MPVVEVDIKQLLEAGAHFGHKTERWHPKMAPYIYTKRNGSHIIDLTKTVDLLNQALDFLAKNASEGKQVLFVGTKRQAQDTVKAVAEETGMPYVTERWLGGMMTNWNTISERVKYLQDLERRMATGELANKYNKLEVQRYQEEIDSMNRLYGGIKELHAKPGAVFIVDIVHEANALKEARKLGVPTVALVDTNADPSLVTYPIPINDDAIKTINLVLDYVKRTITTNHTTSKNADPEQMKTNTTTEIAGEEKE